MGDRPEIQQVLADVLGTPRSRIEGVVGRGLQETDHDQGRVRFTDIPFASPLDLRLETLPPGIPGRVLRPLEWNGVWWVAPRGFGRTLAGRWLAARSLAALVVAKDWESAHAKLPDSGPVFVELLGMGTEATPSAPPRPGVCVAAPFRPSPEFAKFWNWIESAPPAVWLEPLVAWLARRFPRDGHFEPRTALDWLRSATDEGMVDGLGTAIGLAGLIDEHG
ncbi:MAG TPA: hypothetical protein VF395_14380, partial [Polyangiaceae bacterium]